MHVVHIRYRRSGGFAGLELVADTTSDELPDELADVVRGLLTAPHGPATGRAAPAGADRFSYQLQLDDGAHRRTYHWADTDVADDVRPLLSALNRLAAPAPPG